MAAPFKFREGAVKLLFAKPSLKLRNGQPFLRGHDF